MTPREQRSFFVLMEFLVCRGAWLADGHAWNTWVRTTQCVAWLLDVHLTQLKLPQVGTFSSNSARTSPSRHTSIPSTGIPSLSSIPPRSSRPSLPSIHSVGGAIPRMGTSGSSNTPTCPNGGANILLNKYTAHDLVAHLQRLSLQSRLLHLFLPFLSLCSCLSSWIFKVGPGASPHI